MTPRAWSYGLLFAGIAWAALIVALLSVILAAQTVGVEAWHDSAVPAGAFVAVGVAAGGAIADAPRNPAPTHQLVQVAVQPAAKASLLPTATPSPSPRAVPRLAATVAPSGPRVSAPADQPLADRAAASMTGISSWYSYFPGQAAAGPALRVGDWRGRVVTVKANGVDISVRLTDFCQCYGTRLIDLDRPDFARLGDPSLGLLNVEVSW